jgi:hypothetical protein
MENILVKNKNIFLFNIHSFSILLLLIRNRQQLLWNARSSREEWAERDVLFINTTLLIIGRLKLAKFQSPRLPYDLSAKIRADCLQEVVWVAALLGC